MQDGRNLYIALDLMSVSVTEISLVVESSMFLVQFVQLLDATLLVQGMEDFWKTENPLT